MRGLPRGGGVPPRPNQASLGFTRIKRWHKFHDNAASTVISDAGRHMRIAQEVTWHADVFPCWRRSAKNAARPNSDVWGRLPPGVRWFDAELEGSDTARLYLIGSSDIRETFGSYRIGEISESQENRDRFNHWARVRAIRDALLLGQPLERPILVAESGAGPFVIIDGNHRCLAHYFEQRLVGLPAYLGMVSGLNSAYCWARQALQR
jgi:hypothetical protein